MLQVVLYKVVSSIVKTGLMPVFVKNRTARAAGSFGAESHIPSTEWGRMGFVIRIFEKVAHATKTKRPEQRKRTDFWYVVYKNIKKSRGDFEHKYDMFFV